MELDIYRKLTARLHNIKVQLGECPVINSDMNVNVEVGGDPCQVQKLFSDDLLSHIHSYINYPQIPMGITFFL